MAGAFTEHIVDAIKINRARGLVYAAQTRGRSRVLSTLLIAFELTLVPIAWWFDWAARRFQAEGIPIVEADFADMSLIDSIETPPRYRGVATREESAAVGEWLRQLRWTITNAETDFAAMAGVAMRFLRRIEALEQRTYVHHAMSKHFVESIGIAAANALGYRAQSEGRTDRLARKTLVTQAAGLFSCPAFDRLAQRIHRRFGIGILVNDVPTIPFHEAYRALAADDRLAG